MSQRYVCIHGHFYQPPRENPWLEAIELQDSAYPYHDWNERITAECYGPNADSRILDADRRIQRIANNYASISFDFGPTLMAWLQEHAERTYRRVREADRLSRERFSGHGSAMAQAYNHMIMPLANERDRQTQVQWGIADFRYRFDREPEGMWLPETAVDIPTLEALAAAGIRFTVLAPHQAAAFRTTPAGEWQELDGARIDPTRPYRVILPSGRDLVLFFYDGPASRAVAFEGLLADGAQFAQRLLGLFHEEEGTQLVHIATDGETYGHHHRFGDMALAYAIDYLQEHSDAVLTNYGEFLERFPPSHEVRIAENTSWSCVHGVERWRSDCGCHTGGDPRWQQAWRAPLREALDWLRDQLAPHFETAAGALLRDPWTARDDYCQVVLDRSDRSVSAFLDRHAARSLTDPERVRVLKLLELQRHAMLMYTSCGWFFNELSGIETVQVLQYAGRAVQLAEELFGDHLEAQLRERLALAVSNRPEVGNGQTIYDQRVKPARVDLFNVAAHFAVDSLFRRYQDTNRVYCYQVTLDHHESREIGSSRLSVGRAHIRSHITRQEAVVTYAVLLFGEHNISGGIRRFLGDSEYQELVEQLFHAFGNADLSEVLRLLAHFPEYSFSVKSLFSDRQREIMALVLETRLQEAERVYGGLYDDNIGLMRFLTELHVPLPHVFTVTAEFVLNRELHRVISRAELDLDEARELLDEVKVTNVQLDGAGLGYELAQTLQRLANAFRQTPADTAALQLLHDAAVLARSLPFDVELWETQNLFYWTAQEVYPSYLDRAHSTLEDDVRWVALFRELGELLLISLATV